MNLLATPIGRLVAFFLLYVTEGLPLGFAAGVIAVYMRREGVSVEDVGWFIGALYLPWGFKWMFGPVVDLLGVRSLGHRRGWILFAQAVMVVGLAASSQIDYVANLNLFAGVLVTVFGFCALQDVAIDALAVASLRDEDRGTGNGVMFAGASIGQAIGGTGMLWLVAATGSLDSAFYAVAAAVAVVWGITLLFMREPEGETSMLADPTPAAVLEGVKTYVITAIRAVLANRSALLAVAFALLPASAMALGLALSSTVAVEIGMTDEEIGTLGLITALVGAAGSAMGGMISDRTGHKPAMVVYVLATAIPTAWLAWVMQSEGWILPITPGSDAAPVAPERLVDVFWWASIAYGYFLGLTYGTRMAIFMAVCDPKVGATQFTFYMAMSNLAISYSANWQGKVVESSGYPTALAIDCVFGMASLIVLPFIATTVAEQLVKAPGGATKPA